MADDDSAAIGRKCSEPAEVLNAYGAARDRWLRALVTAARSDGRVQALLLAGSLGRGRGDVWSDLDLVVVAAQDAVAELRADVSAALAPPGRRLFVMNKPRNAPAGGAYQGVLWDIGHTLPMWTDWYLWPAATAALPADTAVLVDEPHVPLPHAQVGFIELLDHHRAPGTVPAAAADERDRLLTVTVAAKYLGRGDTAGLARMLRRLAAPDAPAPEALRAAVATVAEPDLAEAAAPPPERSR